jgi:hypothetical protein
VFATGITSMVKPSGLENKNKKSLKIFVGETILHQFTRALELLMKKLYLGHIPFVVGRKNITFITNNEIQCNYSGRRR